MKLKATLVALCLVPMMLVACAKQEETPKVDEPAAQVATDVTISAEQQAAIDSIDTPVLDEKNTDVSEDIANAPADAATSDTAVAASSAPVAP